MAYESNKKLYRSESYASFGNCTKSKSNHYRYLRNKKVGILDGDEEDLSLHCKMKSLKNKDYYDLDFKPLYLFLISKVGKKWDEVYSEAIKKIPYTKPIFYLVRNEDSSPIRRIGEETYYHTLYVDDNGILQFVDKNAKLEVADNGYTRTLNGVVVKPKRDLFDS